jgi:rSAM/selenodomain-associated transferase 2
MVSVDSVTSAAAHLTRVSVIVPVLRDADALTQLVADLKAQTTQPDSVIVVGGSRDPQIARIAREERLLLVETLASRGLQLDTGARTATGDVLWFVHADARLPADACAAVRAAIQKGAAGGCLRFCFQGNRTLQKYIIEWLVRLRICIGGMAYGDQALFITAQAYADCGGFPHFRLFEEVPVVRHLRNTRAFAALTVPVFVSTRRWARDGWLRRSLHNRWLALRHCFGASTEDLADAYRHRAASDDSASRHSNVSETRG